MDLAPGRPLYETRIVSPFGSLWNGSIVLKMILRGRMGGRDIGVIYGVVMGERGAVVTWNLRHFFASIGGNHDIQWCRNVYDEVFEDGLKLAKRNLRDFLFFLLFGSMRFDLVWNRVYSAWNVHDGKERIRIIFEKDSTKLNIKIQHKSELL